MASDIRELLLLPENFIWAWRKALKFYAMSDGLYDHAEVAAFELNLKNNLDGIREDFSRGRYILTPMKLLPQPKKPSGDGTPRMRQSFQIPVRDQVAWIALTNALGPIIDEQMPPWSYGHRLYRSVWFEKEEGHPEQYSRLRRGPYRHANGFLYRKFQHSWPLFRRHLSITARVMAKGTVAKIRPSLDEAEERALGQGQDLDYFKNHYWSKPAGHDSSLYYASIDLEKFYPKINTSSILNGFKKFLPAYEEDKKLRSLLKDMLNFHVSVDGVPKEIIKHMEPATPAGKFNGIPTGLMAAGFLSNVAMLPVDETVRGLGAFG